MLDSPRTTDADALRPVVAAAREAFARYGIHRTRMEDVAQIADMPRQYLYRHVASKNELVELALLERCREFSDHILDRTRKARSAPEKALVDAVVMCIVAGREDAEFATLAEAVPRVRLNALLTGPASPMHAYVKRCLLPAFERARSAGVLRDDVTDDAMVDWIQGVMTWLTPREDLDAAALTGALRAFLLPALVRRS